MNRLNGIQRRSFTLAAIVSVIAVTSTAQGLLADQSKHDNFSPAFYAFQNGVRFSTAKQRVAVLKELGYDGIGSADPNDLPTRLKLYDETGLKIYSLYVGANLGPDGARYDPIVAEAIRQLKGRDTVIEFYLRGKTDAEMQALSVVREVADLAAESGLRMVIYPHAGFYIDTLGDAVRIAEKAERKNVGVMFNLCHFLKVEPESDLKETLQNAQPYLRASVFAGRTSAVKTGSSLFKRLTKAPLTRRRCSGSSAN